MPGTLYDYSADCPPELTTFTITQTTTTISNFTLVTMAIATNLTVLNKGLPSKFEVGSRLFYAVVGAGGGIVVLLICCPLCVCAMLICRRHRFKGKLKMKSAYCVHNYYDDDIMLR